MALPLRLIGNGKFIFFKTNSSSFCLSFLLKSTKIDAIDSFTTYLVQNKALKWELRLRDSTLNTNLYNGVTKSAKNILEDFRNLQKPRLCIDICNLNQTQLDNFLIEIIKIEDQDDFVYIIKQCIKHQKLPSNEILFESLKYLSNIPNLELLEKISIVCKIKNENFFNIYSKLYPFKGFAYWKMGNFTKSFEILINGYENNSHESGQKALQMIFKEIAIETFRFKSEAVLVIFLKTAKEIYENFQDIFILACLWRNAFNSEWFSDQQLSGEIFEKYSELRSLVSKRSMALCYTFLQEHDVESVHRLIELFLKFDEKDGCCNCLRLLFDYQYWRKDLRACSEIMQNSLDLDIPLTEVQNQKLLNLLLDKPTGYYKKKLLPSHKFEYKF